MSTNGVDIWILGDFGPFSKTGKSTGYQVKIGEAIILIDCGAPIFNEIGGHGLKEVDCHIVTHCHDDHKRWFTDLALFHKYAPDVDTKLQLLTSEDVYQGLVVSSGPALNTSLSPDSKRIIDIAFSEYVTCNFIGPEPKYRIIERWSEKNKKELLIEDNNNELVGPERAKIVISDKNGNPRMLFKDPESGEWVEPESYYPFSSNVFYENDKRNYKRDKFTVEAIKAPVWHGLPNIGLRFSTENESVLFTSDTVHDTELWEELYKEKLQQNLDCSAGEFESKSIIFGDINNYIERIWSEQRYTDAINCFKDSVVIQDISTRKTVVHTDYRRLDMTVLDKNNTILTHCPDRMTSEWILCYTGKTFKILNNEIFEVVNGRLYKMNADIYHKRNDKYYLGYRNENGKFKVFDNNKFLTLQFGDEESMYDIGDYVYSVDLYEDIGGEYFPLANNNARYIKRSDGTVELIEFDEFGSRGTIKKDHRERLRRDE
jgi:ribonuclease BN (tRNA processing enzyme)